MSHQAYKKLKLLILEEGGDFLECQLKIVGLYLIAFEMLKDSMRHIVMGLNSCPEFRNGKMVNITSDGSLIENSEKFKPLLEGKQAHSNQIKYLLRLKILNKDEACLLLEWFTPNFRNDIAHRLLKQLIDDAQPSLDLTQVKFLTAIIFKIDNWWIKNVEAPINSELFEQFSPESLASATSTAWNLLQTLVDRIEKTIKATPIN